MSETNKNTIRTVREEALSKRNLDLLDGLYADDYVYHGPPLLGELRGPTAFKELAKGFVEAVTDLREVVEDQLAEGNKVVTRLSGSGRHTGELMGAAPTGKDLKLTAIVISRFENGKIAEEWVEFDGLSFLQQLGLVPELP
ncbi:MAG: ester cyclase [Acidobacteria bacterium]|nr:ester cyclase [Acidobacteriota bacterium]